MSYTEESDDQSSVKSDESPSLNRVKFLCSYGGRIVPRGKDGRLRYIGGVTRVVAASRAISFQDLLLKLEKVLCNTVLLKCQLPTEDLDALVSIKSDEDLENLLEEYDKIGAARGKLKVRAFLYPSSPRFLVETCEVPHSSGDSSGGSSSKSAVTETSSPPKRELSDIVARKFLQWNQGSSARHHRHRQCHSSLHGTQTQGHNASPPLVHPSRVFMRHGAPVGVRVNNAYAYRNSSGHHDIYASPQNFVLQH